MRAIVLRVIRAIVRRVVRAIVLRSSALTSASIARELRSASSYLARFFASRAAWRARVERRWLVVVRSG